MEVGVVIVDDEAVDRMITRKRFERSHYSTVFLPINEAETGEEFLERVKNHDELKGKRSLVLMDVNMPGMNGFETIAELQKHFDESAAEDCSVVMIFTSSENHEDIERAKALPLVADYLVKPLTENDIARIFHIFSELQYEEEQRKAS